MGHGRLTTTVPVARVRRVLSLLVLLTLLAVGLVIEAAAFTPSSLWLSAWDLVVGWTFLTTGWAVWLLGRNPAVGALLAATGAAWFMGTLVPELALLHRGPLIHVLVTYPSWRAASRRAWALIAAGYVTAVIPALGRSNVLTLGVFACLVGYLVVEVQRVGQRERRSRVLALGSGTAWAGALVAVIALSWLGSPWGNAGLIAYDGVLCGIAIVLALGVRPSPTGAVADVVVQLGDAPTPILRDQLSRALRDPTLELGYWSEATGDYRDDVGQVVEPEESNRQRAATYVSREGRRFAIVVHDATTMREPRLAEEISSAVRLGDRNTEMRVQVAAQLDRLRTSRRRSAIASRAESERLETRLNSGPLRHLTSIANELDTLTPAKVSEIDHVERAREHASLAAQELRQIVRGLHSRAIVETGLRQSLDELASRSTIPVSVSVTTPPLPADIEITVWFICAEALANVEKHAKAGRATVSVSPSPDKGLVVTIEDDGQGGADISTGRGLRGIQDRVDAWGGALSVRSGKGPGTQLRVSLPLPLP